MAPAGGRLKSHSPNDKRIRGRISLADGASPASRASGSCAGQGVIESNGAFGRMIGGRRRGCQGQTVRPPQKRDLSLRLAARQQEAFPQSMFLNLAGTPAPHRSQSGFPLLPGGSIRLLFALQAQGDKRPSLRLEVSHKCTRASHPLRLPRRCRRLRRGVGQPETLGDEHGHERRNGKGRVAHGQRTHRAIEGLPDGRPECDANGY